MNIYIYILMLIFKGGEREEKIIGWEARRSCRLTNGSRWPSY